MFGLGSNRKNKKAKLESIEEVIDQLAYKFSIPQSTIQYIVWTWMRFEDDYREGKPWAGLNRE